MKKTILYSLLIVLPFLFTACDEENLPRANFETMEASSLKVTSGDEEVTLMWEPMQNAEPIGYYISWTASSLSVKGGSLSVESDVRTATIKELVNGEAYTFSVQPVYKENKRGGKISVGAKPTSTRIPVADLMAAAGNQMVRLKWTKPDSDNLKEYRLLVSTIDDPIIISKEKESFEVEGLTNDVEYEFSLICVYPNGTSDAKQVKATPGKIDPVIVESNALTLNEPCSFTYNDLYFTMGVIKSASWDFGDGNTSIEKDPIHAYTQAGTYKVKVTVTYEDGTSESGTIEMAVSDYLWSEMLLELGGLYGNVKVSNPVFSPDGKTAYIPTSTPNGHLFAVDVSKGSVKWVSQISAVTYGGGALVGSDGTIYQCGTDKKVYAIAPADGSSKWTCDVDGVIGAFPALSSTNILYCATNSGTLYAINSASGSVVWSKSIGGTSSAVAVDQLNNVYVGTNAAIYKFNESGEEQWKTEKEINVTERGAFAMDMSGSTLYATLKSSKGLVAVDMASGTIKWTYANIGGGDAYFPIVGTDGVIFFNDKGGKNVYAVNSSGSLVWSKSLGDAPIYCGLVLADNGLVYCATQGKTGSVYKLYGLQSKSGDIEFTYDSENQFMAGATVGLDKRIYIGTIGSGNKGALLALPIDAGPEQSSWSVRGGNIYGTNRK